MGTCIGMNLDQGHAIRFPVSYVRRASPKSLIGTIAHELAHTEQKAEGVRFEWADNCEVDVEERLRTWGFDNGATEEDRRVLLGKLDEVIEWAGELKWEVGRQGLPSGNFAAYTLRDVTTASHLIVSSYLNWIGRENVDCNPLNHPVVFGTAGIACGCAR
jgi:hypothetical protein